MINPETPTILYAGTEAGVFKSTDGGANWSDASSGLTSSHEGLEPFGPYITQLSIDPETPTTIYAVGDDGVFKSMDGGEEWVNIGFTGTLSLTIDTTNPTTLYAGTINGVFIIHQMK